ncbi:MAG: NYN domain-containing protein [Spirulinaceae cyanobacterium SM2_1_0]|nr:NYN domain-containing protein [Spirulinaceae cyanobacterium SM2_1_0]
MATASLPTLLLVDGYNIIGAWSSLQLRRDRDGLESARRQLVETLINYAALAGMHGRVVFDAHYQRGQSSQEIFSETFHVHYTDFGQTADTYIEKVCADFSRRSTARRYQRIVVATSDRAQQQTTTGYGAQWWSADELARVVEQVQWRAQRRQATQPRPRRRLLANYLDPRAQERLAQWRSPQ